MKVFTAEEAKARVAEFNAERERINQRRAEEIAEQIFDEIREKSANGLQCYTHSITEYDVKIKVMKMLADAGYDVADDFSRMWIKWGE